MEAFIRQVRQDLFHKVRHNKLSLEKLASSFGITDKTEVKEYTELAIVEVARSVVQKSNSVEDRFNQIVGLYKSQANLSHRTSQSVMLQQYSTPAPIGYLAGVFTLLDKTFQKNFEGFEPSAGNGLLTIAGNPQNIVVNEIDTLRRSNLHTQGFKQILSQDATRSFQNFTKRFDAVITNPPFGTLDNPVNYNGFAIKVLDHLMALRALDTMKDTGRAAIIIGGHTQWDEKGRIQAGKNRIFFNYLYRHYQVVEVLLIDGHKLYSRQGTAFDVRLILINGRKSIPEGVAPIRDPEMDIEIKTFDALFERVTDAMKEIKETNHPMRKLELEAEALQLQLELLKQGELGAPYQPASEGCIVLNTVVPDSMSFETHSAIQSIKEAVGGDIDEFVRHRLNYPSKTELCKALSAEQIDAVAMAIYNIEARGQG
ncbi:MAG: hypothetical protein M3Q97_09335, partial [Bacteroidota bacterium]|nr:hypothetical protein [Bacteroidota bacterium]